MSSDRRFEKVSGEIVYEGAIFKVEKAEYRYPDGETVTREIVRHPGAVGIVPVDDTHVWLVRQPREAAGDPDMLEIPAGKLDEEGEEPLDTGRRELAEEIGRGAETWEHLTTFFTSVGVMDEEVHLYLATGLHEREVDPPEHDERIEVVAWPLEKLDEAIAATRDSKTIIGLLMLQQRLRDKGS
jgi:8-oxo-dGTP pyrophosphatase MutT (NUDIX family)